MATTIDIHHDLAMIWPCLVNGLAMIWQRGRGERDNRSPDKASLGLHLSFHIRLANVLTPYASQDRKGLRYHFAPVSKLSYNIFHAAEPLITTTHGPQRLSLNAFLNIGHE